MSIYDFTVKTATDETVSLEAYKGNVLLIVNTATGCGFAPQLEGMEQLFQTYKDKGFTVFAFPCNQFLGQEPLADGEIAAQCNLNYGTTFPFFKKVDVKGSNTHPLFNYLTNEAPGLFSGKIKWNFTKFLIDRNGNVVDRFAPSTKPEKIAPAIETLL